VRAVRAALDFNATLSDGNNHIVQLVIFVWVWGLEVFHSPTSPNAADTRAKKSSGRSVAIVRIAF